MFRNTQEQHSSGTRVVKTTTTTRSDGATETTTTEVLETTSGGRGVLRTTTSTSSGAHAHLSDARLFDDFDRLALESSNDGDKKSAKKSTMGAILGTFGGGGKKSHKAHDDADDVAGQDEQDEASFANRCLKAHNEKRKLHGVPHLKLSKKLNEYAKKWADSLAREDSFRHSDGEYGENIYMKWSSDPKHKISGDDPVNSWYDEIKVHTFGREPANTGSGHFTQVVWKATKELGVAFARSKSGKILVVASYSPAGNLIGTYVDNVPRPLH